MRDNDEVLRSGLLRLDAIQTLVLEARTQTALLLARAPQTSPRERQVLLGHVDAVLGWLDARAPRAEALL